MLLDARTFLPRFAVVKTAKSSDPVMARILCNPLRDGEIVVFDKAYVDFKHLFELFMRNLLWVTRAKTNMSYRIIKKFKSITEGIILDAEIVLDGYQTSKGYPVSFRLIIANVQRDGKMVRMEFITNNFDFAASTICDLYKGRWDIELFFKQLKLTLKLSDFLGYSENAVLWQMATFSITAVSSATMTYQWQQTDTNKVTTNILRATKEAYSIAPTMVQNRRA